MVARRKIAVGAASLAAVAAVAIPLRLTQGSPSINVWVGSTPTPTVTPTPTPDPGQAHLWVDTNGGTCSRDAQGDAAYSDAAACGTFDAAWDAATAGDVIRVRPGTYAEQLVTGDKASETWIIGDGDGDDVTLGNGDDGADCATSNWSVVCANAARMTLENVTAIVDDPGPYGGLSVNAANVTVRDYHILGEAWGDGEFKPSSIGISATGFTFDGGSIGRTDTEEQARCSHSSIQPMWFQSGGDGATIRDVQVGRYEPQILPPGSPQGFCSPEADGTLNPHLESIRFEDADNVTFIGVTFNGPSNAGSGHIYSSSDPDGITFVNSIFEDRGLSNAWNQMELATPSDWTWLYTTILDDGGRALPGGGVSGETMVGNYGFSLGCGDSNTANVYRGSGSCSGVTFIGSTDLGVDANGRLTSGSAPAVDQGETPGASDECTGPLVDSVDIDGDSRPFGDECDVGADEWSG